MDQDLNSHCGLNISQVEKMEQVKHTILEYLVKLDLENLCWRR